MLTRPNLVATNRNASDYVRIPKLQGNTMPLSKYLTPDGLLVLYLLSAQRASAAGASVAAVPSLEEVVVNAQKHKEKLQDMPI
jgi:hypothetical protein